MKNENERKQSRHLGTKHLVVVEQCDRPFTDHVTGADPGFGQGGGPRCMRPKVADRLRERSEQFALRALEAFGFLMRHSRDFSDS